MATSLQDKVVLVTGSSGGIGAATALHFAKLGCRLALVARNVNSLEEVAAECRQEGSPDVLVDPHDLAEESGCRAAIDNAVKHFGGLDCLVNNAGVLVLDGLSTLTTEQFDLSMTVNARSAMTLTQASVEHLERSSLKSIVNVSSIAGLRAYPGSLAYKMSKAAMDQLTRCSALELAAKGIRVNSVNPGVIDTDLFVKSGMSSKASKAYVKERSKKTHPLGRHGTVEEVAKVIAFLASDDASFVSGQTLAVCGGRSVMCPS